MKKIVGIILVCAMATMAASAMLDSSATAKSSSPQVAVQQQSMQKQLRISPPPKPTSWAKVKDLFM